MLSQYPKKIKAGDNIRIIAPSLSLSAIDKKRQSTALQRLTQLGLTVSFGKHVFEIDEFDSSSIQSRIADLHEAFLDPSVQAIMPAIGGFNSIQLLMHIDWEIIKSHPKVFCGFSDVSTLHNAIYSQTGLVTYSGPDYAVFGQQLHYTYTRYYFEQCVMNDGPITIRQSPEWSDFLWYINPNDRVRTPNAGLKVINKGIAKGTSMGGNLSTLTLLQGTQFFPDLRNTILFLEDDELTSAVNFDRDLESLLMQPGAEAIKGLVVGRFQSVSNISDDLLKKMLVGKKQLQNIPIIIGADFGHTDPKITFPIGGKATIQATNHKPSITIDAH